MEYHHLYQYGSDQDMDKYNKDHGWGCAYRSTQNVIDKLVNLGKIKSEQFPKKLIDMKNELNTYYEQST